MAHFTASSRHVKKRARILTKAEFKHALDIASLTRDPERNTLMLCMTHALGVRVSECARITARDLLFPSGRIREELTLRSDITKFNKARTVPVSNRALIEAIDAYIDHRIQHHMGIVPGGTEYRGLSPDIPLILSERGTGFALSRKTRILVDGSAEEYLSCDTLENAFRRLYRSAGLRGASSHSGRRYYASTLLADGNDIETISLLLGHSSIEHTAPYLEVPREELIAAFAVAL